MIDKAAARARIGTASTDWHLQLLSVFAEAGSPFNPANVVLLDGACKALAVLCWYGPHVEFFSQSQEVVRTLFEMLTSRRLKSRKQASWALAALLPLSSSGVIVIGSAAAKTVDRVNEQGAKKPSY